VIDAILFACRDAIRSSPFGYGSASLCEVMTDGHPPPVCGDWFAAVHQGASTSNMMNALDEYFGFNVTLTRRVTVAWDRFGNLVLASKLARTLAKETGFNARAEQLRSFLHMNWGILQDANTNLVNFLPNSNQVYGFCEPAHFAGMEQPQFVLADWFSAETPELASQLGIKAELRFEGARRLQAIGSFV
jgi:hypothetical protein